MKNINNDNKQVRRQRRAIWILSIALAAMTFFYFVQVRETVKSDRAAWELQDKCDELQNDLGMVNYELGMRIERDYE